MTLSEGLPLDGEMCRCYFGNSAAVNVSKKNGGFTLRGNIPGKFKR